MNPENPLLTLGVPQPLLVKAAAEDDYSLIQRSAEIQYRQLARWFHPDNLETGDVALMGKISDAMDQIRDPDVVAIFVEELVGRGDLIDMSQRQLMKSLQERDRQAIDGLASTLEHGDQFRSLGVSTPVSLIAALESQRVIINVLTPSRSEILVTPLIPETSVPEFGDTQVLYRNRRWHEMYLDGDGRERYVPIDGRSSRYEATIVGFIDHRVESSVASHRAVFELEADVRQASLNWSKPTDAWYLQYLQADGQIPSSATGVVLYANGKVALTEQLLGVADME
ncbi:hypothetical protein B7Y92_03085 [Candidatus Saccharibacteria bacterium 32-50-13]|nr:MAG: hypothetical protein B7Y92_03085 [Candidatus Saccharibacteria bacterium 32-50-13]